MTDAKNSKTTVAVGSLLSTLKERAKELSCLYAVEEVLRDPSKALDEVFEEVVNVLPPGWQYPDVCEAKITYGDQEYMTEGFGNAAWCHNADITVVDTMAGMITVAYTEERPQADQGPFLREELKLIATIAERLGHFILHQRTRELFQDTIREREGKNGVELKEWRVAVDLLRRTDVTLFSRISRKMMNLLCWRGVEEAKKLLQAYGEDNGEGSVVGEVNEPLKKAPLEKRAALGEETFRLADKYMSDNEILTSIRKWVDEDQFAFLVSSLVDGHAPLKEISDALIRYRHLIPVGGNLSRPALASVRVSLIRRFFTEQLEFINIARDFVEVEDFYELISHLISPAHSHGKLGGKSAGLFLAERVLERELAKNPDIGDVRTPSTWYVTSDGLLEFLRFNKLEDVYEQKYKSIGEVRQEYPHIIQVFKSSHFPQEMVKGFSLALDELGNYPLIVRSSSLLEDRLGSAFSGKYKSLFLANQGDKKERLEALEDAVAEVYASTFGPDPIEYRAERGLLDFNEEMGIMIQAVVGKPAGKYFAPAFAGVAFSQNEFRWSPRIKREDGLVRLVPGLGTRAVDRLSDDYPVLAAPGQPRLRVNASAEETVRYAPRKMDLMDLEENRFVTKDFKDICRCLDGDYPGIGRMVAVFSDGRVRPANPLTTDFAKDDLVVTFDGLFNSTPFLSQMKAILKSLEKALKCPVDIEFACDGEHLYLLQCRPQSSSVESIGAKIPKYVPEESMVFSANKYVSNGRVPDLTHIVYVSPDAYSKIKTRDRMVEVGRAVSRLNEVLPKRQFVLMGPGRWGSRGDIKLGVQVTYSDINNTAMLVEIARKKGNYLPDLSFGTHFFQDLVEASIRYLPLYPDDKGVSFNERFLEESPNVLSKVMPDAAHLEDVLRVINVPETAKGKVLRVLMNADKGEAVAMLSDSATQATYDDDPEHEEVVGGDDHWRWRHRMVERIGNVLDSERFGVEGLYLFGSTKNGNAGPASDIDILLHFRGNSDQRADLERWLEGWSECLDEINFLKTGCRCGGLLDVHIVTDEDIERRSSFAIKIDGSTDPALKINMD